MAQAGWRNKLSALKEEQQQQSKERDRLLGYEVLAVKKHQQAFSALSIAWKNTNGSTRNSAFPKIANRACPSMRPARRSAVTACASAIMSSTAWKRLKSSSSVNAKKR